MVGMMIWMMNVNWKVFEDKMLRKLEESAKLKQARHDVCGNNICTQRQLLRQNNGINVVEFV